MKTTSYNPSPLEVEFSNIIESLKLEINAKLNNRTIESFEHRLDMDNPTLKIFIKDDDGDKHCLVIKLIQKPDDQFLLQHSILRKAHQLGLYGGLCRL